MGILDKKTRFIDLVITQEGKRQIAAGKLRAEFASLSDIGTFYSKADHGDVDKRIYFEVMERPENSIVLEKDDSGKLIPYNFSPTGSIVGNDVFEGSVESDVYSLKAVTGSQYSNAENAIISSSLRHFKANRIIGSFDKPEEREFETNISEIEFLITNNSPFKDGPFRERIHVNNAEPLFLDSKMSHLPNFQFLPPVNTDGTDYGIYTDPRSTTKETWDEIKEYLGSSNFSKPDVIKNDDLKSQKSKDDLGTESRKLLANGEVPLPIEFAKPGSQIYFTKTSADNNVIIQFFEDNKNATINKLDIIDAGIFYDKNDELGRHEKRVFYVGKVFTDDYNTPTFINIFTIVMD